MANSKFTGPITVDPVTRVEGHVKIRTDLKNGVIEKAFSSTQLFRGLEMIVKGRPPQDVHNYVQRACGVCTTTHSLTSIRAVENSFDFLPPPAAQLVRHLILSTLIAHDHLVHFYHLHSLDFFDMADALNGDPLKAAALESQLTGAEQDPGEYYMVKTRLKKFVDGGQLGWLTNAYFLGGHPAYKLTPEENLIMASNYLTALRVQLKMSRAMAIFSGKNPHSQTMQVGGVTCYEALRPERFAEFRSLYDECRGFYANNFRGDLMILGKAYPEACVYGGTSNYFAYDDFLDPETGKDPMFRSGVLWNRDFKKVDKLDTSEIKEHVAHSWYEPGPARHPYEGVTEPKHSGYDENGKYSWSKAPRYKGESMECGPLARRSLAYARGEKETRQYLDEWLKACKLKPANLFSTLGRTACRMAEANILVNRMPAWIDELEQRAKKSDVEIFREHKLPDKARGVGFTAVTRGALSHWINIDKGTTANYQMVVPSTWNMGPRCEQGKPSAVEESLQGVPVLDPERPVEILRTVHSFDPCNACSVHVIRPGGRDRTFKIV
ncbi:nickel-dependent hydrogenase large subunit [Desulfocurvus sp. DL9XJH121]